MVWIPFWSSSKPEENSQSEAGASSKCPVDHTKLKVQDTQCPVVHKKGDINPHTNMPYDLSATNKVSGQKIDLPTERTMSSIPRGENPSEGVWEYPSPQQMLNAIVRKGHKDTPEEDVPAMVDVHNFLNEGAWSEILKWEQKYTESTGKEPRLLKFTGRPDTPSPRARFLQFMSVIYPSKYSVPPPFDRHDWTVLRYGPKDSKQEIRYVIDYYSGEPEPDGYPTFSLDVRPALDSFESCRDRLELFTKSIWDKAIGEGGRKE
ncbi:cytochrome c/c1 heme-lyase [Dipodascopsis uninucleata]